MKMETNKGMNERFIESGGVCPFCGDGDFDLIGLKNHFYRGYCEKFNETEMAK